MEGFIVLHRKILEWEWYSDLPTRCLFEHCLLKANWKDKKYQGKTIKRGSFLTGRALLAKESGLSVQQVRRALSNLQTTNEITTKTTPQGTEITVVNYDQYQKTTNKTTNEQPAEEPTDNQQTTTTNKDNKDNKEPFDHFWDVYPLRVGKAKARKSWEKIGSGLHQEIIDHVQARKNADPEWLKNDGEFIPHPTTFLNQERWEDEYKTNVTPISSAKRFSDRFVRINTEKAKESGIPQNATDKHGNTVTFWPDGSVTDSAGRALS